MSWVIISGLFVNILSPSGGFINQIIKMFDGTPVYFMMDNAWFRTVLVVSKGWKEIGWNAMIYIADIAGMDEKIYESAVTI